MMNRIQARLYATPRLFTEPRQYSWTLLKCYATSASNIVFWYFCFHSTRDYYYYYCAGTAFGTDMIRIQTLRIFQVKSNMYRSNQSKLLILLSTPSTVCVWPAPPAASSEHDRWRSSPVQLMTHLSGIIDKLDTMMQPVEESRTAQGAVVNAICRPGRGVVFDAITARIQPIYMYDPHKPYQSLEAKRIVSKRRPQSHRYLHRTIQQTARNKDGSGEFQRGLNVYQL